MKTYSLEQWAVYLGLTLEEVYEDDIMYIIEYDDGSVYKVRRSTGEMEKE